MRCGMTPPATTAFVTSAFVPGKCARAAVREMAGEIACTWLSIFLAFVATPEQWDSRDWQIFHARCRSQTLPSAVKNSSPAPICVPVGREYAVESPSFVRIRDTSSVQQRTHASRV